MTNRDDRSIWPGLTYDDAVGARAWLTAVGFTEGILVPGDSDGEVVHSEMIWPDGGRVMVHSACRTDATFLVPTGSGSCYVVTADPDGVWASAQAIGADVVRGMEETDYGSRGFSVADPEGNRWSFGTYDGTAG